MHPLQRQNATRSCCGSSRLSRISDQRAVTPTELQTPVDCGQAFQIGLPDRAWPPMKHTAAGGSGFLSQERQDACAKRITRYLHAPRPLHCISQGEVAPHMQGGVPRSQPGGMHGCMHNSLPMALICLHSHTLIKAACDTRPGIICSTIRTSCRMKGSRLHQQMYCPACRSCCADMA